MNKCGNEFYGRGIMVAKTYIWVRLSLLEREGLVGRDSEFNIAACEVNKGVNSFLGRLAEVWKTPHCDRVRNA